VPIVRLLRSASFARAVLLYLALLCGVAAWFPWVRGLEGAEPPAWARATGFDRPFSSPWLLAGVAALFASTFACTWGKRARTAQLWRGELPPAAVALAQRAGLEPFLRARGFGGAGPALFRHRWALWGGLVLHWGLLALIAGVGVQQAFEDGGNFQLAEGERRNLAEPGAVFQRTAGPLAPAGPPELEVTLLSFDPFRHQPGYSPDRLSEVRVVRGGEQRTTALDRAAGVRVGGVDVYQAIPSGLAAVVESPGAGRRALHLAPHGERQAVAEVRAPSGALSRLVVTSERPLSDRMGTGALSVRLEAGGGSLEIAAGEPFVLGGEPARIVGWTRWAGFTYARTPGLWAVFAGFGLILAGATLLSFPAGVARLGAAGENGALVWMPRGAEALRLEWERGGSAP